MPMLQGVDVHVTDSKGQELAEWGVRHLRKTAGGGKVSAYIQADTGLQFHVSVQPRIPFVDPDHPNPQPRSEVEGHYMVQRQHTKHSRGEVSLSSPDWSPKDDNQVPKYVFVASLFLDGRAMPERKIVIYLNDSDRDFARPHGKVTFKHRWVQSKDGTITEHAWVFKENAIESLFDRLIIATSEARKDRCDEDAIIEAMRCSGLGSDDSFVAEDSKVGQIVVELKRVILGEQRYDRNYRSRRLEDLDDDIDMDGLKSDVTHATGFAYKATIVPSPRRVVDCWDYKPEEGVWATFQFFYRSAEQLHSYGFPGCQNSSKPATRAFNACMADLTPLSIAQPMTRGQKMSKQDMESFEEEFKKKSFKPEDSGLQVGSGSEYRDVSADDEMEAEETYKHPAAALPILAPKAPKVGPQRNITTPSLPKLNQRTVSGVAPTLIAARALIEPKEPNSAFGGETDKPVPDFSVVRNAPFERPDHGGRRRLSLYPVIGDSSKSPSAKQFAFPTPHSIRSEQESSSPLLTSINKQNLDKLGVVSRHGFRNPPPARGGNSDADDEAADDENNTESDLETHADAEALDYSDKPDEEEEGHRNLRSQFKNVAIKKRAYAEIEDAAEEDKVPARNDGAVHPKVEDDGDSSQAQKGLSPPMTERETDEGRSGKKARTITSQSPRDLLFPATFPIVGIAPNRTGEENECERARADSQHGKRSSLDKEAVADGRVFR